MKHLNFNIEKTNTKLNLDQPLICRILDNLYHNAIKYSNPNSTIDTLFQTAKNEFRIVIKNSGPTIPSEYHKIIFEKSFFIDRQKADSSGLGLYFCNLVMQKHGGRIEYTIDEKHFNVFSLYFKCN